MRLKYEGRIIWPSFGHPHACDFFCFSVVLWGVVIFVQIKLFLGGKKAGDEGLQMTEPFEGQRLHWSTKIETAKDVSLTIEMPQRGFIFVRGTKKHRMGLIGQTPRGLFLMQKASSAMIWKQTMWRNSSASLVWRESLKTWELLILKNFPEAELFSTKMGGGASLFDGITEELRCNLMDV